jgi:hypothetical protein
MVLENLLEKRLRSERNANGQKINYLGPVGGPLANILFDLWLILLKRQFIQQIEDSFLQSCSLLAIISASFKRKSVKLELAVGIFLKILYDLSPARFYS